MYENLTRTELIEELASLEDCLDAKASEQAHKMVEQYRQSWDDFLVSYKNGAMDTARSALGQLASWNECLPYRWKALKGIRQSTSGFCFDLLNGYFGSSTPWAKSLWELNEAAEKLKSLLLDFEKIEPPYGISSNEKQKK